MNGKPENRVDRIVSDLLRGRRLKLRGSDAEEKAAITAAARLAGARQGTQRMHPAFRKRLAERLDHTYREAWVTRRTALVAGLGLAAGTAAGAFLGRSGGPEPVKAQAIIDPLDGRWVDVGALSEFPEGELLGAVRRQVHAVPRTSTRPCSLTRTCTRLSATSP